MITLRRILLLLCTALLTAGIHAQEDEVFELPLELPYATSSDAPDFPRDDRRRIVEDPAIPKPLDHPLLRRSGRSLIPWKDLKQEEFLSVRRWIAERAERDKDPLWKIKLRLSSEPEQVGKVISCVGTCILHRGSVPNRVRWLSRVLEGDEVTTTEGSYLWMMLTDGTLVRLSPLTSVAMLEMNLSKERFFFHARLNQGHMYWKPRQGFELVHNNLSETDRLFLPVMDRSANVEFFQRELYQAKPEAAKIDLLTDVNEIGRLEQIAAVNKLVQQNNAFATIPHHALIVTPNGNVLARNVPMTFFYAPGGKTYFKYIYSDGTTDSGTSVFLKENVAGVTMFYRGYTNTEMFNPEADQWIEVSPDGRTIVAATDVPALLTASEILHRRIPTISLVREKWVAETKGLWESIDKPEKLATDWGLRLWGPELEKRQAFLEEFTRRVETTNLRALERLVKKTPEDFDGRYFSKAMDRYFSDMKRRHSFAKTSVLEMIPLHYYGWVLINAKQQ